MIATPNKYKRTLFGDIALGLESESLLTDILETEFGSIKKTSTFHPMDFENEVWIELKTRTFNYNKYPTTLLPYNKIEFAKKADKPVWFVFAFTDGVYKIKYSEVFESFEINQFQRKGRSHTDVKKDYIYIPIEALTKIE